jgi:quinol monooxygenase YgiN
VHARSITLKGRPGNVDAGIAFVEGEAAPMVRAIEGCRGLSLLVDRDTGECIVTSSWESEAAMRASDPHLRPLRERGRDILGGSMEIDEWEILVMHRTHHAACCRVSWLEGDVDAMAESFRTSILPDLEQTSGFCSGSVLADRASGVGCATTAWESRDAMVASRSSADRMRARAASDSSGRILRVHEYELAYAHLHVPEMV